MNVRPATVILTLLASSSAMGASIGMWQRCETPLTLRTGFGLDSNPLRLAGTATLGEPKKTLAESPETPSSGESGQAADAAALLRPSLSLHCAATPRSSFLITVRAGLERFRTTTSLNTTTREGELRLFHRFSHRWSGEAFGLIGRSNQPDVLATQPARGFATFTENREGFRLTRSDPRGSTFTKSFVQNRGYGRLLTGSAAHQRDTLLSFTVGRWQRIADQSFLGFRVDYLQNRSNNSIYRYREPAASISYVHWFPSGLRLEIVQRSRWLDFPSRPVSTDPARMRRDFIAGLIVGVRKELTPGIAATASYGYDKDFSSEPLRRFNDHRVWLGLDFTVGSRTRRALFSGDDAQPLTAAEVANLGYAQIRHENWNEALRLSLEAIRLDPELAEAHTNAGIAYYKLGNRKAAIAEWQTSLALRPNKKVQALLQKVLAE